VSTGTGPTYRTFRDPAGILRMENGRVLRTVRPQFAAVTQSFVSSQLAHDLAESGWMIPTASLGFGPDGSLELEHRRVFFPSYPWEWCVEQWVDAAVLTLDLCDKLLDHGLILKDATPLNILFCDARPVLVDVLSIEPRDPGTPLWRAYGQFVRTFVLPLLAHRYLGWPLAATFARRDGYEPEEIYPHLGLAARWRTPARGLVTLPVLFDKVGASGKNLPSLRLSAEATLGILRARLRGLKKMVLRFRPAENKSRWSGYTQQCDHYSESARAGKERFVRNALAYARPRTVLDIGANTGSYAQMAAAEGALVVALDTDAASTAIHYRSARQQRRSVLPLCADFARPTPAAGWNNRESLSLLERCRKRFDCVLMLGLLHHLLVTDQVPLHEIASLLVELAPRFVIVEWIPRTDLKFVEVCRGRDALYEHLDEGLFHQAFGLYFRTVLREELGNGRVLMLLEAQ
jgi:SAM-dependent methyltransferase